MFIFYILRKRMASMVKNMLANAVSLVVGLGRSSGEGYGSPLQYSCLEIPWTEEPGGLQPKGSQRAGHNWAGIHPCIHVDNACNTCMCAHRCMFAWVCLYMKVFLALVTEKTQRHSHTLITPGTLVLDIIPCFTKRNDGSAGKWLSPGFIRK